MKQWAVAVAALLMSGCFPEFENPHLEPRGLTEEELNRPPGHNEIRAALVNDARNRRSLRFSLDDGQRTPPDAIKLDRYGVQAVRAKDGFKLWRVPVWEDHPEKSHAVTELAYWDDEQRVYFYHYEGGNPHRDVWMGPFPITFSKRPAEDGHDH
jgi:hypothetical protein